MLKRVATFALVCVATACGSSTPSTPTPTQANLTLTLSPNPVTATVCSPACVGSNNGNSYKFRVTGNLTIQESAGIGGNVDTISTNWCTPACVYSSADVTQRSGTSRILPHGMLVFPLSFVYGLTTNSNASRSEVIPLNVQITDDRGNKLTPIVQWTTN